MIKAYVKTKNIHREIGSKRSNKKNMWWKLIESKLKAIRNTE